MAAWPDEATAREGVATSRIWQGWRARAQESWTLYLHPTASRGTWAGGTPFQPDGLATPDGPCAALTRATLRPRHMLAFWRRVPAISQRIGADANVAFKIGIGEMPLRNQVTFSVWPDLAAMAAFARSDGPHAQAIKAVRDGDWFAEELYARFQVFDTTGTWGGVNPLAPLIAERDAA